MRAKDAWQVWKAKRKIETIVAKSAVSVSALSSQTPKTEYIFVQI